ncbi:hypothetical protein F5882DRAFT_367530 [Hyaloscypha sp. PMI_1271]|nr:hypothetical protein F5882DRAFT_367530 [Hyaloscypha sp. PMI_1271]
MSAPTHAPVPSGQAAPFLIATPTDHSPDIVLVAATGIALILLTFVIRIYIRFNFSGPWLGDDTVFAFATVVALAQSSVVCVSVHHGWGRVIEGIDPFNLVSAEKLVYAADILYIVTLALSKHSLDLLFIRLSPFKKHLQAAKCIRYFVLVWTIASLGAISLRCNVRNPWTDITSDQCPSMLVRWQVITAFNIISEVAIFGMSFFLVEGLRMPLSQKAIVIAAFGIRLPTIIFCALRIHFFSRAFFTTDPSFDGVFFSAWTQVEIAFSVMTATTPCLKPFMSTISTNWGEQPKTEFTDSSPSGSYGLRDLFGKSDKSASNVSQGTFHQNKVEPEQLEGQDNLDINYEPAHGNTMNHRMLRGDSVSHTATVMHGFPLGDDGVSTRSNDSQQMIIRKERTYSVEHGIAL